MAGRKLIQAPQLADAEASLHTHASGYKSHWLASSQRVTTCIGHDCRKLISTTHRADHTHDRGAGALGWLYPGVVGGIRSIPY